METEIKITAGQQVAIDGWIYVKFKHHYTVLYLCTRLLQNSTVNPYLGAI
jgi:predicted SAM-dependent methyltransferase